MGLLALIVQTLADLPQHLPPPSVLLATVAGVGILAVVVNVLQQLMLRNPHEPPVVFHWFPFFGSTVWYGMDPFKFFFKCREKYGDVFTFVLLGRKTTVCLGIKGNEFILNAKLADVNAEEVYTPLTTPVFGSDVVYDCPNSKLMEQKKFVKYGLTTQAFESYVPLIVQETLDWVRSTRWFPGKDGVLDVPESTAEVTIYTAARSLQGKEVRDQLDSSFADMYHDLDAGFSPVNFMLPWFPFPHNIKRDAAHKRVVQVYLDIIEKRKSTGSKRDSDDMIWNLMDSVYKSGQPVPDKEVAHMMIALLMAGQHSSASTSAWMVLRLAQNPKIAEELLQEQKDVLGEDLPPLTYENIQKLPLNNAIIKETLRMHAPIHSMLRRVKQPLNVEGTSYTIPPSHWVLAAPGVTMKSSEYFPDPNRWDPHRWEAAGVKTEQEEEQVDYGYGMISKGAHSPYLPFGAGRHRCIGEQFAYLQLGTIIATTVRYIRFYNLDGQTDVVNTDYSSLFSVPMRPAKVKWERRNDVDHQEGSANEKK
ncbi:MAG: hypothetical protein Q9162_006008 [Coniocarpon cinnabarinum]